MIRFLFKLLAVLIVLGGLGLVGFAYLGDLNPEQNRVTEPLTLPLQETQ